MRRRRTVKSNPRRRRAFGGSMHYGDPEGAYGPPAIGPKPGPGTQGWHRFGGLYRHGDYAFDGASPFVGGDVLLWHESRRAWENLGHASDIDSANDLIARRMRPNKRRSRRNAMMWKAGKESRGVAYEVNLEAAPHLEEVLFTDAQGRGAVLKRYLRPVVWFKPTESQVKKIIKGKGKINITNGQITDRQPWPNTRRRKTKRTSRRPR